MTNIDEPAPPFQQEGESRVMKKMVATKEKKKNSESEKREDRVKSKCGDQRVWDKNSVWKIEFAVVHKLAFEKLIKDLH